mgnify:FL=1
MPYIAVNVSRSLSNDEKEQIKTNLGAKISTLPNKSEARLMVQISDNCSLYFAGNECEGAFIDVRLYGHIELQYKKEYAEQIFDIMSDLGFKKEFVYLSYLEFENWGTNGSLK